VTEVCGMDDELHIKFMDVFRFRQEGVDPETKKVIGNFVATGHLPTFYDDLITRGIHLPRETFSAEKPAV